MKSMKNLLVFLFFALGMSSYASRYTELMSVINQELNEVVRLSKQILPPSRSTSEPTRVNRLSTTGMPMEMGLLDLLIQ